MRNVLQEATWGHVLLRLPRDPLEVWAVDKVTLEKFSRDPEAVRTEVWNSEYNALLLGLAPAPQCRLYLRLVWAPSSQADFFPGFKQRLFR